ncbi:hypothetical protein D3C74_396330 [compost metagenome]
MTVMHQNERATGFRSYSAHIAVSFATPDIINNVCPRLNSLPGYLGLIRIN